MFWYIIAFILGVLFHKHLPDLRQRFFAAFMNNFDEKAKMYFAPLKDELLGDLKNLKSKLPGNEGGSAKVLEIGVGTGANFQYYPDGCHLTVVDPNPHFKSYYNDNRAKFPNVKSEEIIVGFGENMHMVADESMDAVVITLVLCCVQDVKKVLEQAKRVLVPGGKLYYLEHVREFDPEEGRRRMWQDVLTKTGIWPGVLDGCHLNRETYTDIHEAGFADVVLEKTHIPGKDVFYFISSLAVGVATK